jgi:hypothetical protein
MRIKIMGRTIFPKDCFVCDHCNIAMSDSKFVATEDGVIIGIPMCQQRCKGYINYYENDEKSFKLKCEHVLNKTGIDVYHEETYCTSCLEHWKDHIAQWHMQTTMVIRKGQDYSGTVLATPIIFED